MRFSSFLADIVYSQLRRASLLEECSADLAAQRWTGMELDTQLGNK